MNFSSVKLKSNILERNLCSSFTHKVTKTLFVDLGSFCSPRNSFMVLSLSFSLLKKK